MSDQDLDNALAITTGGASLLVTEPRRQRQEAAREQRKASAAQRKIQDIKTQREKRRAIREARAARAEIVSGSVASGTSASSSTATGTGSIGTQLGSNLSFLDEVGQLTNQVSLFEQKAADRLRRAGDIDSARNTALQVGSLFV